MNHGSIKGAVIVFVLPFLVSKILSASGKQKSTDGNLGVAKETAETGFLIRPGMFAQFGTFRMTIRVFICHCGKENKLLPPVHDKPQRNGTK